MAAALSENGKKVLVVDCDPQGNTTTGFGFDKNQLENCIYNVLIEGVVLESIIKEANGVFVAPATINLAGAEIELVSMIAREYRLKKALEPLVVNYDFILIDCPPSLGLLTINALTAANGVLIPIQCEYYALEGLSQLVTTIQLVKNNLNPQLNIEGVLLTMHDPRTNLSNQVVDEVKKYFPGQIFDSMIPRNVRISEAPSFGLSVLQYAPDSKGAIAYRALAQEVLQNEQTSSR